ncbi:MAG: hypothetical protein ACI89X_003329 [Planctomycetota bacterium]|jgi:hypothetical protein
METTASHELYLENIRARARRLRRPVDAKPLVDRDWFGPSGRFDRVSVGLLLGILIDAAFLVALMVSTDVPFSAVLLLGPLVVLFAFHELVTISVVTIFVAGVTRHWRVAVGLFLFQAFWALLGFGWLALVGTVGFPF